MYIFSKGEEVDGRSNIRMVRRTPFFHLIQLWLFSEMFFIFLPLKWFSYFATYSSLSFHWDIISIFATYSAISFLWNVLRINAVFSYNTSLKYYSYKFSLKCSVFAIYSAISFLWYVLHIFTIYSLIRFLLVRSYYFLKCPYFCHLFSYKIYPKCSS